TESGTYTFTTTNAVGCDSTATLNLTINNSNNGFDTQVHCDTYTWIDGVTYTSSNNTAKYTLTNLLGCDSVVTLNLIILNSITSVDTQVHCDSYTWIDGITYTSSNNTASWTLTNQAGCDSLITLDLTIHYSPEIPFISQSQSTTLTTVDLYNNYNWYLNNELYDTISGNSLNILEAGVYTVEVIDLNYCSTISDPFYFGVSDVLNNILSTRIYPNPARNYFMIESNENIESIEIVSLSGKLVRKYTSIDVLNKLSLSGIQNGTYIINLNYFDGANSIHRLIKTN
ncbi:MAG: hypothetical protein CMP70_01525, partial [Flavobacteriales bacterium]|nr:hypothetical protein [Flavobacteriales bacterium]